MSTPTNTLPPDVFNIQGNSDLSPSAPTPAAPPDVITSPSQVQTAPPPPVVSAPPTTAVPPSAGLPPPPAAQAAQPSVPAPSFQQKMQGHMRNVLSDMLEAISPSTREVKNPVDTSGNPVEERREPVPTGQRVLGGVGKILGGMGAGMAAAGHGGGGFGRSFGAAFNKEEEMQNESQARQKQLVQNNLTMYQTYRNHLANDAATQEKNSAVAAPVVEGIRDAISTGKAAFPVNEAKGVVGDSVAKAASDFHAQHPEMEVVGFPTGQNAEGKNIYSLFYGRNLHDLTMTANEQLAKQQGIAVGADISLAAAGNHVVNQIAETNLSHQASRELGDNPWETKLEFSATVDGKTFKGDEGREKLLGGLDAAGRERVQKSFLLWSKIHTQTYRDPEADLKVLDKIDPTAAADVDKYLYGEGNITKLHSAITDYAVRAKTEGQKDLENGPLNVPNAQSIKVMHEADPTRFTPARYKEAVDFLNEQHSSAIQKSITDMETEPSKLAGENALAASAQLSGMLQDDTVKQDPKLAVRINRLITTADTAHKLWSADKRQQASAAAFAQEAAKNGPPEAAGKLLADYTMTIGDLKNRNLSTQFITNAVDWAQAHPSTAFPDHPYSVSAAAGWESAAKSPRFVNFFGNSDSLIRPAGTLDQLIEAGNNVDKINDHDWKILRETKNWTELQQGHPELSGFAATALGVADDYAKVLGGGGTASDTSRAQILHIIDPSLNKAQRAEAVEAMRKSVYSQRSSYIGGNPFLKQMYGDIPAEAPQGAPRSAVAGPPAAPKIVPKGKVAARDGSGNVVGYADDNKGKNLVRF